MRGRRFLPPDPRPSRADPEARRLRKEMEKEHHYEWVPPIVLGLLGITLAFDVAKDVSKAEERKKAEEEYQNNNNNNEHQQKRPRSSHRRRERESRRPTNRRHRDDGEEEEEDERREEYYEDRRRGRGRTTDEGLDKADQLERGEGGGWDRDGYRRRRSLAYDDEYYDYGGRSGRGRDDAGYESEYDRRGRAYDDRRARPRPRRRSSDW